MNAYFRMNNDIFMCPAALELSEKRNGDSNSSMRVLIFIRILCYSIAGGVCFVDAKSLSAMLNVALKQAQNVWDVCIKHSVLRKDGYGYSAREWMCENGFFGAYGARKEAESVPVPAEAVPDAKENIVTQKDYGNEVIQEVFNAYVDVISKFDKSTITNKNKCEMRANEQLLKLGIMEDYTSFIKARQYVLEEMKIA